MRCSRKYLRLIELQKWACSSAGRAPALQAGGRRFEPAHVHQLSSFVSVGYLLLLSRWQLRLFDSVPNFVPTQP
jgi:hypothetical protein